MAVGAATLGLTAPELAILAAVFVAVPLGVRLLPTHRRSAEVMQFPAAVLVAISFAVEDGRVAMALAVPWLLFTVVVAWGGLSWLLGLRIPPLPEFASTIATLFLVAGGVWLVVARAGVEPLNSYDHLSILTAVHFHFAGFVLPLVAVATAERIGGFLTDIAVVNAIVGTLLVALGIAGEFPRTERWGSVFLAIAGTVVAANQMRLIVRVHDRRIHACVIASSLALAFGMVLAAGWALRERFDYDWITLEEMARYHGLSNALGFSILSLVAWNLAGEGHAAQH